MLDNTENPYTTSPDTVYRWGRSRVLGGRTLHWARASDRMADYEFKAASRDGYGMDWAVGYADMSPYYDRVERFIGVSGAREGLPQFPDGEFLAAHAAELRRDHLHRGVQEPRLAHDAPAPGAIDAACTTIARRAIIAAIASMAAMWARCSTRLSSTLPPALKTGNLEVRTRYRWWRTVRMNGENRAQGVTYIERFTGKPVDVDAKYVILAAPRWRIRGCCCFQRKAAWRTPAARWANT